MKKQNAAIWCALLLVALPIAVLLLVPSPSARIVDVVQPLMESEEIDYWNPDIFFLTKYGLTAAVSALCGLALTLLCSRKRLSLDTRAAICTVAGFGALVGARVLYMLARYSYIMVDLGGSSFFWQFWQGGYTLYGGILGGMGAIALYAKLTKQKALPLLDAVTPGALLALCITAAGFALNIFAAPGAWFFAVLYTVLYAVGQAGLSQNMVNMAFNYVPADYFVHATAIKNSIGGICGFTASLLGGWLLGPLYGFLAGGIGSGLANPAKRQLAFRPARLWAAGAFAAVVRSALRRGNLHARGDRSAKNHETINREVFLCSIFPSIFPTTRAA